MQKFVQDLKRDQRKAIILGVLVVIGIGMGAKSLFKGSAPEDANASIAPGVNPVREAARTDIPSTSEASQDAKREQYLLKIDRRINRDLFSFNSELFTLLEPLPAVAQPTSKPIATQPTQPDQADIERTAIFAQAQTLRLQSVISGPKPTAIINDNVLRVGDWAQGFQVMEIANNSCVVQKKDVRVMLELSKEK